MFWRIHKQLVGDRLQEIVKWISSKDDGHEIVDSGYQESPDAHRLVDGKHALALTTLRDANNLKWNAVPGLFWDRNSYNISHYMSKLPEHVPVLNRNGFFLTADMIKRYPALQPASGSSEIEVFVRPNSGNKSFPGQVLRAANESEWRSVWTVWKNTYHLMDDELCWCSPVVAVSEIEWRVWIVGGHVVAWSPYSWSGDVVDWHSLPNEIAGLAEQVAKNPWQLDDAYVVDFAIVDGRAWLVEINAASTSGLYQVPIDCLMTALRNAALSIRGV